METPTSNASTPNADSATHVYLLLDRSGSMEAIRPDVVGGVNAFVGGQRAQGDDAVVTMVQFDTVDAHEVVYDAVPIAEVTPLTTATFVPRGGTPLLDASGDLIHRAEQRADLRRRHGLPAEHILVVTVTDGEENSSRRYTTSALNELVTARKAQGWSFAYLSADPAAYADAQRMGYDTGSISQFAPSPAGAAAAFSSLGAAIGGRRARLREGAAVEADNFFEGDKSAEDTIRGCSGR